jgi:two-component system, LytTR family, sensor kinase
MRTAAPRTRVSIVKEAGEPPGRAASKEVPRSHAAPIPNAATRLQRGFEILLIWSIVGLFIAAQRYLRGPSLQPRLALPWSESLAASLVTAYLWAFLTPAVMRVARRLRPRAASALWRIPLLLLVGAAAALVHLTVTNVFWHAVGPPDSSTDFSAMFLATLAFGGAARLATFFGIVGVTWGIDDYRTYREKELQASELERELVQTQLEALKLRLHPPFLFNTLSTILPLIRTEPRAAARTVVQLGDILRLALHNDATGLVPLKTELEYIRLYLQIEQTRLRDRLDVHFAISPDVFDAAVPNLILLPLVESAIANGVSVRPGRASIEVRAWPEEGMLRLEVHEAAMDAEVPAAVPIDDSFVRKTKMRLELLYPERHRVSISDRLEKGHEVSLRLPLETATAAVGAA